MADKNAVEVLKTVPLFQGLEKGELRDVASAAREELYSPGQDIVTEGQAGGPFFCITEGRADVLIGGDKTSELGPGSYFGEMALLEGGKRSATIRAETHVKALAISSWNFLALLQDNWEITKKVLAQLSARVRELDRSMH
jgi:CRP-like cAMP-binding protein